MSVATPNPPTTDKDPEDDGRGANLTILGHLQELRSRLMICGASLAIAMVASFSVAAAGIAAVVLLLTVASRVQHAGKRWFLIVLLIAAGAGAAYSYTVVPDFWNAAMTTETIKWLKRPAESRVENFSLVFTDPLEFWSTFFQVSLLVGLVLSMPIIVYQILGFVTPGLTRTEKKWTYFIVVFASLAFVGGCAFAYYVEMPPALNFLLKPPGDLATPLISVKKYIGFATKLMLVTGLVFQTPLFVMAFAKVGIVHSRKLLRWWRYAIVGAFIISAIVTPSIDPITQALVAVPMIVLYFVGILMAKFVENTPIIPRV
ncbi:MAG TPA: twin-arginine translocase subunit TatC [Dehalococcoidia bacterium]|nr:twin-arginine translocase subunit TatC [Dehalococcoidia bacterium]